MHDLSKLDVRGAANQSSEMVLRHPVTGEELSNHQGEPMVLGLLGMDSDIARRVTRETANKNLRGRSGRITVEKAEQNGLDLMVALTTSMRNIQVNGEILEYSPENVRKLYTEYPWVQEQADQWCSDRANYLGNA